MYEHIFQHYVTFLQNGVSRAMTHHHSPGWWVMTHHSISRGWQVCILGVQKSQNKIVPEMANGLTIFALFSTKISFTFTL